MGPGFDPDRDIQDFSDSDSDEEIDIYRLLNKQISDDNVILPRPTLVRNPGIHQLHVCNASLFGWTKLWTHKFYQIIFQLIST